MSKRIISGTVLFALLLIILIFGNTTIVNITASVVGILAITEYFNAFKGKNVDRILGLIVAVLIRLFRCYSRRNNNTNASNNNDYIIYKAYYYKYEDKFFRCSNY